jgi:hypothetical protein
MLSTATRLRSHLPVPLFVEASVTLSSTETFRPIHAVFLGGRQQAGSSSSSSKHQQKHHTRRFHTRVMHLKSSTNRSNTRSDTNSEILKQLTKLNESNVKIVKELKRVGDELGEVKTDLAEVKKIVYRTDKRAALTVEARCREKMGMEHKEVKGVHNALSLLSIDTKEAEYDSAKTRLVSALYRRCTRDLFAKVTGTEWINENEALASLKQWQHDPSKESNSTGDDDDDDDDDVGYSAQAEADVVKMFIEMLAPFAAVDVDKKQAHKDAQEILRRDNTGLALSLIIANMDDKKVDKGGYWGWKVLEFDGFSHSDFDPDKIELLEVKCGSSLRKAKKQLEMRTRFIDTVATLAEYKGVKFNITKYAYVDGVDGLKAYPEPVDGYMYISSLKLIVRKIEQ